MYWDIRPSRILVWYINKSNDLMGQVSISNYNKKKGSKLSSKIKDNYYFGMIILTYFKKHNIIENIKN